MKITRFNHLARRFRDAQGQHIQIDALGADDPVPNTEAIVVVLSNLANGMTIEMAAYWVPASPTPTIEEKNGVREYMKGIIADMLLQIGLETDYIDTGHQE